MEKVVVDMIPTIKDEENLENKTPSITDNRNVEELRKLFTPDRLKVPKAFKYPERYRSPTDAMMSPNTKGLLARNRKPAAVALLPPSLNNNNHTKIQELSVHNNDEDDDLCQTKAQNKDRILNLLEYYKMIS